MPAPAPVIRAVGWPRCALAARTARRTRCQLAERAAARLRLPSLLPDLRARTECEPLRSLTVAWNFFGRRTRSASPAPVSHLPAVVRSTLRRSRSPARVRCGLGWVRRSQCSDAGGSRTNRLEFFPAAGCLARHPHRPAASPLAWRMAQAEPREYFAVPSSCWSASHGAPQQLHRWQSHQGPMNALPPTEAATHRDRSQPTVRGQPFARREPRRYRPVRAECPHAAVRNRLTLGPTLSPARGTGSLE